MQGCIEAIRPLRGRVSAGTGKYCAGKLFAPHIGPLELRPGEIRAPHDSIFEKRPSQVRTLQIGSVELSAPQVGLRGNYPSCPTPLHSRVNERASGKRGLLQRRSPQVGSIEIRPREVSPLEVSPVKVESGEIST